METSNQITDQAAFESETPTAYGRQYTLGRQWTIEVVPTDEHEPPSRP